MFCKKTLCVNDYQTILVVYRHLSHTSNLANAIHCSQNVLTT